MPGLSYASKGTDSIATFGIAIATSGFLGLGKLMPSCSTN